MLTCVPVRMIQQRQRQADTMDGKHGELSRCGLGPGKETCRAQAGGLTLKNEVDYKRAE